MIRRLFIVLFVTAGVVLAAQESAAVTSGTQETLDFNTVPYGGNDINSSRTFGEGSYTIQRIGGTLWQDTRQFFGPGIRGDGFNGPGGGTLSVKRTDGGLFLLDEANIFQWIAVSGSRTPEIKFYASVNGSEVSDFFTASNTGWQVTSHASNHLKDIAINELRIDLDADYSLGLPTGQFTEGVNSLKLTAVPEPTSIALLGLGGLLLMRRRR